MKKWILSFLILIVGFGVTSCNKELIDYSVEDAFSLMNEAIQDYLDATSLSLVYSGTYTSSTYNNVENMEIKMKEMGSSDLIGKASMEITENSELVTNVIYYEDGYIYTNNVTGEETQLTKQVLDYAEYESLYSSFLKSQINYEMTREVQIIVSLEQLTVHFELASAEVESTFFVSPVLSTVNFATVDVTLNHDGRLLSLNVTYDGTISSIVGTETYSIVISKINQYVIIDQLSYLEKANYEEVDPNEE
ncbi:MAG: hypothetical protein KJ971_02015 [Firmicutes bacterium]|nr:hypothetical protein [Bacillota bacterium]